MSYAISGECCSDASCVAVCPMNSIHPSPGEPGFGAGASLFIDPRTCIDCGACADICPVDAAQPADQAAPEDVERNAAYFADAEPLEAMDLDSWEPPSYQVWGDGPRRVLVVGAGPAGMYATRELLLRTTAEVTLVDLLADVGGLVRYGVAPDHPRTKQIIDTFQRITQHPRVRWRPGTDGGLGGFDGFDAVIHAVGARWSRRVGFAGEEAACTAEDFVAWYNGRPGATLPVQLTGPRAVVIGNGNVALDVARLLLSDAEQLDVPPAVRAALRASGIKEVVLVGRRGPDAAAYTETALQELLAAAGDRVELRYHARPVSWTSEGLTLDSGETIAAGNLFTAIGFEGRPVDGLPFDADRGIVPNVRGAVVGRPGHYVAGWIKRGARGGIGVNKACAQETVMTLVSSSRAAASPGS
ncbi:FAD-dependent oxidoreductase [Kribbella sindirgiensis]|uniref:ferredoxin--NADP(+) reductase n=1 Tax=Kribbella sindirgiensis TaxID=1124744 RepID=A0A4R0IBD8_9ACTN|nr:FAD-dependent oxidoreductase [Kribbella sindirgiensis]TCC30401.1 ferredoxin-NADP reductase [Kribbella sindirgiensis]